MRTQLNLAASFLVAAAVMAGGRGHENDTYFFCKEGEHKGVVSPGAEKIDTVRVSLAVDHLVSTRPYAEDVREIWSEVYPRDEIEDAKNLAKGYCYKGIVPQEVTP